MAQNTPTGSGSIFPTRGTYFGKFKKAPTNVPILTEYQFCKKHVFLSYFNQTVLTKVTVMTVGSFHVFGKKVILTAYLQIKSHFFVFPLFLLFSCKRSIS